LKSGAIEKSIIRTAYLSLTLLFFSPLLVRADMADGIRDNYQFIKRAHEADSLKGNSLKKVEYELSPLGFVGNSILTIYQTLVSSQDSKVCNFQPSCSHFARQAINRAGFIKGSLMASDRLLRCHPGAFGQYRFDPENQKSIDPVENYLDGGK
jgi:putative membrane protein insertion efficiency factor